MRLKIVKPLNSDCWNHIIRLFENILWIFQWDIVKDSAGESRYRSRRIQQCHTKETKDHSWLSKWGEMRSSFRSVICLVSWSRNVGRGESVWPSVMFCRCRSRRARLIKPSCVRNCAAWCRTPTRLWATTAAVTRSRPSTGPWLWWKAPRPRYRTPVEKLILKL